MTKLFLAAVLLAAIATGPAFAGVTCLKDAYGNMTCYETKTSCYVNSQGRFTCN